MILLNKQYYDKLLYLCVPVGGDSMKELKKALVSVIVLAVCIGLGMVTGLQFSEFISSVELNLLSLVKVAAVCAALLAVKSLIKAALNAIKKESTVLTLVKSLLDYAVLILAVVWSLRILGADINGIIAGLGILGLIIGMSAQDIINDLLTGIFLLVEQEYKVGDYIEVNGFSGKVTEIGVRTTCITDNGGNEKIINNSSMKNILNKSSYSSVAVVDLELPRDTDPESVLSADLGDIKCVGIQEIKPSGIVFRFTEECSEQDIYDVRRRMNNDLLKLSRDLRS